MTLPINKFVAGSAAAAILAIGCSTAPTSPGAAAPTVASAGVIPGIPAALTEAIASGLNPTQLAARGWTCRVPPPTPERTVCIHPNGALPSPLTPVAERAPAFTVLVFANTGAFLGTQIGVREDLYSGQICESSGAPYIYRPAIGYYECLHTVGS